MNEEFEDEMVIGTTEAGIELVEGVNQSIGKYYCSNCKRQIHCYVTVAEETDEETDEITKVAKIHNVCTNQACECRCKTHYICRICSRLHPHGQTKCSSNQESPQYTPEQDKEWEERLAKIQGVKK